MTHPKPDPEETKTTPEPVREHHAEHSSGTKPAHTTPEQPHADPSQDHQSGRLGKVRRYVTTHKKISIPLAVLLLLGLIMAIPVTRYAVLGLALDQQFSVSVIDEKTGDPVSGAEVTLGGKSTQTDSAGAATIQAKVGNTELKVAKKYYKGYEAKVLVAVRKSKSSHQAKISATGRQVPVTVTDKLSGKPIADALIKVAGTETKTAADGTVTVVVPADAQVADAEISSPGFNTVTTKLKVTTAVDPDNAIALVPAGQVYFLSRQSGTIDVVKTDLDGNNRTVVLKGTGREIESDTRLLPSFDWKYLTLKARRDSDDAKLYLIEIK